MMVHAQRHGRLPCIARLFAFAEQPQAMGPRARDKPLGDPTIDNARSGAADIGW